MNFRLKGFFILTKPIEKTSIDILNFKNVVQIEPIDKKLFVEIEANEGEERPHITLLRLRKYLVETLGYEYKIGIRKFETELYYVFNCNVVDKNWLNSEYAKEEKGIIILKKFTEREFRQNVPDRVIRCLVGK